MNAGSQERVAIVTGASRGIGAAIALALARRGIGSVLAVRDPAGAEPVREAVELLGVSCLAVRCDVTRGEEIEALVRTTLERRGRIDIVVNNAGQIGPIGHIADTAPQEWARNVATNLVGPYALLQAALPELLRRRGTVVNISSGAAERPLEGWSAYCSAKAALAMLTRSIALEYGAHGVMAYGFRPGTVDTGMQEVIRASKMNDISRIPRENLGSPERAAHVAAWLADARPQDLSGKDVPIADPALLARVEPPLA